MVKTASTATANPGAKVTYTIVVTNTGTAAINGWTLAFSYPGDQHITSAWNAAVHPSSNARAVTDAGA